MVLLNCEKVEQSENDNNMLNIKPPVAGTSNAILGATNCDEVKQSMDENILNIT